VTRIVHLGFEVRVDLEVEESGAISAQVTRHDAERLQLGEGRQVWVRTPDTRVVASAPAPDERGEPGESEDGRTEPPQPATQAA
jgi:molybdopterin-binding protein